MMASEGGAARPPNRRSVARGLRCVLDHRLSQWSANGFADPLRSPGACRRGTAGVEVCA